MIPLVRPDWPAPPQVRACITTRAGGVSPPPYASLNLATHVGDAPAADDAERTVFPGTGVPGLPGYDPTPREPRC